MNKKINKNDCQKNDQTKTLSQKSVELEKKLEIQFQNKKLLLTALTHKSYSHHKIDQEHNERLEFLGDAVLKLIISEFLFEKYPTFQEGDLSKIRSQYVSDKYLSQLALKIELGKYILFSKNEFKTGGTTKTSNLANAFEALLGAYFLDKGFKNTKDLLLKIIEKYPEILNQENNIFDYKSRLQEFLQQHKCNLPEYIILKEEGPDHEKKFHVEVNINLHSIIYKEHGIANTKKEAEQLAAKHLLEQHQDLFI